MISNEERLQKLDRYDVVDSAPEPRFDRLAELAARVCDAPLALISFLTADRVFIKATYGDWGPEPLEIPLELSCCAGVIERCSLYVIEDAGLDPSLAGNPFVHGPAHLRFYAGAPVIADGQAIGSVCVLAHEPRSLSRDQARALTVLATQVMDVLEARRELLELRRAESWRAEAVDALLATKTDLEHRIELRTRDVEQAHQRMVHILERVQDGFVALDRDWRYLYVNERAGRLLGRPAAQLVGKHIWTEFPEGVGQPFQLAYERAMREQVTVLFEEYYAPWNRWFENRIHPSPDGISIFFTEVTDRKLVEVELKRSHARLVQAQRISHVGSWEWDAQKDTVTWSDELHRIYGVPKEGFVGSYDGFLSRVHPDDLAATQAVISEAYQHPKPFEYDHRIVRPDGSVRMLHTRGEVLTDEHGRTRGMMGSCWDTTDQTQMADELRRLGALLQAALEASSDALLVLDGGGQTIGLNARMVALWNIPGEIAASRDASVLSYIVEQMVDARAFLARAAHDQIRLKDGRMIELSTLPRTVGAQTVGWVCRFSLGRDGAGQHR